MGVLFHPVRRWIDENLVSFGAFLFALGALLTVFESIRSTLSITAIDNSSGVAISFWGLAINIMAQLAGPFIYNGALLVAVGLLLRKWRVTFVGFEGTAPGELLVQAPDHDHIVWVGKTYPNALDAELAAAALASRLTRVPSQ